MNFSVEVHAQEGPASVTAVLLEPEVHAQESPASVTVASSDSSTSHVSLISQASDDGVDSSTAVSVNTFGYRYRLTLLISPREKRRLKRHWQCHI